MRVLAATGLITLAVTLGACSQAPSATTRALPVPSSAAIASPAPGGTGTVPSAVSCASPADCWAVGVTGGLRGPEGSFPRAIHWDGIAWKGTALSLPAGGTVGLLAGVSCAAGGCVAVDLLGGHHRGPAR